MGSKNMLASPPRPSTGAVVTECPNRTLWTLPELFGWWAEWDSNPRRPFRRRFMSLPTSLLPGWFMRVGASRYMHP